MTVLTDAVRREFLDACNRISVGRLTLRTPDGQTHHFGTSGDHADMEIKDWSVVTSLAARGDVGLGETYVAGLWETTSIERLVSVALRNLDTFEGFANPSRLNRFKFLIVDRLLRANSLKGAARNIKAHYDVGNEFYQLWLDKSMTYSSALFGNLETDLETAQANKYDRVLSRLSEGERVLEIGCGWGGFAERASAQGRHVTGLTISPSQKGYAEARLDGNAEIRLEDYRKTEGRFDNIVSIEMIEAVGERYWPSYFGTLKDRLAEGGRAVVQAITVQDSYFDLYRKGSDYIRQYTFPGGAHIPATMSVLEAPADGYTLFNWSPPSFMVVPLTRAVPYSPLDDFTPLFAGISASNALYVRADSPYQTFEEFIEGAKETKLTMGVNNLGAPPNLSAVQLASEFGLEFKTIALKTVPATMTGLIGGQVDVAVGQVASIYQAGDKVRPLIILDNNRQAFFEKDLPGVRTVGEAFEGKEAGVWVHGGFAVRSGTPQDIVDTLLEATKAINSDEVRAKLPKSVGWNWVHGPDNVKALIQSGVDLYSPILDGLGLLKK